MVNYYAVVKGRNRNGGGGQCAYNSFLSENNWLEKFTGEVKIIHHILFIVVGILCRSRQYPYSSHRRDWNFLGVGGSIRPKHLKKCMKLNWDFQRAGVGGGGVSLGKSPFRGGGMDIFWNYTLRKYPQQKY